MIPSAALAWRGALVALLAPVLVLLAARSSLASMLPVDVAVFAPAYGVAALLLAPALLVRRSPLPATLAVVVPTLVLASYAQSRLDWLRVLKNFHITAPGAPDLARLALALAALALTWALHAGDHALRFAADARRRGVAPREARRAAWHAARVGAQRLAIASGGALALLVVSTAAARTSLDAVLLGRAALLAPLVAALLVTTSAWLLVRGGRERDA